jgi:cysteinyl-tRNA synthetase
VQEESRRWEEEFHGALDMLRLSQCPPVELRVSEHVPEMVEMAQEIVDAGFAYKAEAEAGSGVYNVFFDSQAALAASTRPVEERLAPERHGRPVQPGQTLHPGQRHPADFALWKAVTADDGGYRLASSFGPGLPGWHLECSTLARLAFGRDLDIHAGGCDLRFPHHENEVLQCEAVGMRRWPQYFLHTGHLHIAGRKMSKSLKNFVSIREWVDDVGALDAGLFRWFLLQYRWDVSLEWSPEREADARSLRDSTAALVHLLRTETRTRPGESLDADVSRMEEAEQRLFQATAAFDAAVDAAVADAGDTPTALGHLSRLGAEVHSYLRLRRGEGVRRSLLTWVLHRIEVFLDDCGVLEDVGGVASTGSEGGSASADALAVVQDAREQLRSLAATIQDRSVKGQLYAVSDAMRDRLREIPGAHVHDR